jgi:hypothetical protein
MNGALLQLVNADSLRHARKKTLYIFISIFSCQPEVKNYIVLKLHRVPNTP